MDKRLSKDKHLSSEGVACSTPPVTGPNGSCSLPPVNGYGVASSLPPMGGGGAGGSGLVPPTGGGGAGGYSRPATAKVKRFVAKRRTFGHGESGFVIEVEADSLQGYDYMDEHKVQRVVDELNAQLKKNEE